MSNYTGGVLNRRKRVLVRLESTMELHNKALEEERVDIRANDILKSKGMSKNLIDISSKSYAGMMSYANWHRVTKEIETLKSRV